MSDILALVIALLLVLLNGFFVAAEFCLVKLRETQVQELAKTGGWRGRLLFRVHRNLDAYLSACQLGITLASLGLGWLGEPAFASLLRTLFSAAGITSVNLEGGAAALLAIILAFAIISFLHIVVGEQAPKTLAIRIPQKTGLWAAGPLYLFYWLMYPAIWLLNVSSNGILKLFGVKRQPGGHAHYSPEEIKLILRGSRPEGAVADTWKFLGHALDFGKITVADLMLPLNEAVMFNVKDSFAHHMEVAQKHFYSRYPVFDPQSERVIGMIDLKDILFALQAGKPLDDLQPYLRPVQYIPPDMPAVDLFKRFREGSPHFAIIGRRGLRPSGFLTLANLLSALVGQMNDDVRQSEKNWKQVGEGVWNGHGSLPLLTLERLLGVEFAGETAESAGGLVMNRLGKLPHQDQVVDFDQFTITVKTMDGRRIDQLEVRLKPPLENPLDEDSDCRR